MANKDYYQTLGVDKSATEAEIKKAFRKAARKHHPDAGGNEDTFKSINEAYEILGDKEKRKQYDQYGQYFGPDGPPPGYGTGGAAGGSGFGGYSTGGPGGGYTQVNMEDFDFGDLFGSMFGGGGSSFGRKRAQKGNDLTANLEITFEEAFKGTSVKMTTPEGKELTVKVPPGANDGGKLRFKGKGSPGLNGGPAGDLMVITKIKPHRYFSRDKSDVVVEIPLTIVEATLGTNVSVPLPTGEKAKLRIPAGTQDGKVFRMKEKGAPKLKGGGHGDLRVKVKLVVPKDMNAEQEELLRKLEQSFKASDQGDTLRKHLS